MRTLPVLLVGVCAHLVIFASSYGQLTVEIVASPNFVVDSNVESPSTNGPEIATVIVKVCNTGPTPLTEVFANIGDFTGMTPGLYPARDSADAGFITEHGHLANSGFYSFTHHGGASGTRDATRFVGDLAAGECVYQFWHLEYPIRGNPSNSGDAVWGLTRDPNDDLWLQLDAWATSAEGSSGNDSHVATMRNEISAMANKVGPPVGATWTVNSTASPVRPGDTITVTGTGFNIGVDNKGFDNDNDFAQDYNVWLQPVGEASLFDPSCFRIVKVEGQLRVSRSGGNPDMTIDFEDNLFFANIPNDTNGATGDITYTLVAVNGPCSASLNPYQEVASGSDNEKFNGDYGFATPPIVSEGSLLDLSKAVDQSAVLPGATLTYDMSYDNPGADPVGRPDLGLPLALEDSIPVGTTYVGGSAEAANTTSFGGTLSVLYSTDGGVSWLSSEPGDPTTVTDLQWWLGEALPASASVDVQFQATVDDPFSGVPLVDNTAGLGFGGNVPFIESEATTLIQGNNSLGDTVWKDTDRDGTLNGAETGIQDIGVNLYYDVDGDGLIDPEDPLIASQDTASDGTYAFTGLPDGNFIAQVDTSDPQLPSGSSLPDAVASTYAVDLDSGGASATGVSFLDADWPFMDALQLTKSVNPSTYLEGELVTYQIALQNHKAPPVCTEVVAWGSNLVASASGVNTPLNAADGVNGTYADVDWVAAGAGIEINQFDVSALNSGIAKVEALVQLYIGPNTLNNDDATIIVPDGLGGTVAYTFTEAELNAFAPGAGAEGILAVDISASRATWAAADFTDPNFYVRFEVNKDGGQDGESAFMDALGVRITCDGSGAGPGASPSSIDPLPLTDVYDADKLQFVSASIAPDSVTTGGASPFANTGTVSWSNVGPLHAGDADVITVTFKALEPADTDAIPDGEADPTTHTNTASVTGAFFLDGSPANDASDTADITINPSGEIGDRIWFDTNGDGLDNNGEVGLPGVTVELLDGGGSVIATAVTDDNGNYLFEGLADGTYTVRIDTATLPGTGFSQTYDPDGNPKNDESTVTIDNNDGDPSTDAYLDRDFGYDSNLNAITGTLFEDNDGDGIQDPGEAPLVGVDVTIGGTTVQTDANGFYSFTDLPDGNYTVTVTQPADTTQTLDPDGTPLDNATTVSVSGGTIDSGNDFAYQPSGSLSLGDTLFVDWDGDGVQESGEEGIPNVDVLLYEDVNGDGVIDPATDALIATDTTDANGVYGFTGLLPDDYIVVVDTADPDFPTGVVQTADPDGTLDNSGEVTLTANDDTVDFGYQPIGSASIGDTVFVDADGDGLHDSGETGIANITVTLYEDTDGDGQLTAADAVVGTAVTDANGNYLFENLAAGDYLVDVDGTDPDLPTELSADGVTVLNYISTSSDPHAVTVVAGEQNLEADFGFAPGGSIGNFVWEDLDGDGDLGATEPPISGMTVNLYLDTDGNGTGDVLIDSTTTDADGLYVFDTFDDNGTNTGLPAGNYVVEIVPSGTQTVTYDLDGNNDTTAPVTLLSGQDFTAADFAVNDSSTLVIGDTVWLDSNGDGLVDPTEAVLSGVKVDLIADDGFTVVDTVYTDSFGNYVFGVPDDGSTYSVVVDESTLPFVGLVNTTDKDGDDDSDSGQFTMAGIDVLDADFGYQLQGAYDISGTAFNDTDSNATWESGGEPTYEDVIVYLWFSPDGGTTWINIDSQLTGPNGSYNFEGYPPGDYTVAAAPNSAVLIGTDPTTPQNQPVTIVDSDITEVDFGFVGTASIGDTVFYDTNGDGVQQAGEDGIPGIQVTLTYPNGQTVTTTTDSSGNYLFEGLGEGPHTITVDDSTLPVGTTNTADPDGTNDSATLVNLVEGQTYVDGDFGYQAPGEGSIGDTVWADLNSDGVHDPDGLDNIPGTADDEFGIEGVTVELYTSGQTPGVDTPLAITTTDADGLYGFPGLTAGDYIVFLSDTGGALDGYTATYDEDDGLVSPNGQTAVNLPANDSVHETADFGYNPTYASISGTVYDDDDATNDDAINAAEDTPVGGVVIKLWSDPNGDGDPSDGVVVATTVTDSNGDYSFDGLLPGDYVIVETDPSGFTSDADTSGANDNRIPIDLQGVDSSGNDFLDDGGSLNSIGGVVYNDTGDDNLLDGSGEKPVPGVTVSLYRDTDGDGVYTPGTDELIGTALTGSDGSYLFENLPDGDYVVVESDPPGATSDTDADGTGTNGPNTVAVALSGGDDLDNDFLDDVPKALNFDDFITAAGLTPGTPDGQPLPDGSGAGGNPDGDWSSNLLEHAFCDDPTSGVPNHQGFCVELVNAATGQMDASFIRAEGIEDVIYTLQGADSMLGPWFTIATIPAGQPAGGGFTAVSNGDETETVTYANVQNDAGYTAPNFGFARLCVSLDSEPDGTPDTVVLPSDGSSVEATDYTRSFGWQGVDYNQSECASFSHPYSNKPVFSGTVDGNLAASATVDATASAGGVDLATLNLGPIDLDPGAGVQLVPTHYLQITSGVLEGERFDIASASAGVLTLVDDPDIFTGLSPALNPSSPTVDSLNTSHGVPADGVLAGASFQVLPHKTIDQLFDKNGAFAGLESVSDETRLLFYDNRNESKGFATLSLADTGLGVKWVYLGDAGAIDQGSRPVDRCTGNYIHSTVGATAVYGVGLVADYDIACPLNEGHNLAGAPYPLSQTPEGVNGRAMAIGSGANQFNGAGTPGQSSQLYLWRGDQPVDALPAVVPYVEGYESFMAADDGGAFQRWVDPNDPALNDLGIDAGGPLLLPSWRAVTIEMLPGNALVPHIYPRPGP